MIDASVSVVDSAMIDDQRTFACGSLAGAMTADLVCDHVFLDLDWDVVPATGYVYLKAYAARTAGIENDGAPAAGNAPQVAFQILTPSRMSPLTETCAALPPEPPNQFKAPFTGSYSAAGGIAEWTAACGSATQVLPGTSFELVITSVGALMSDTAGADPLDASADTFDWANLKGEVLSNSFHGTLKATLVGPDGGAPLYVDIKF